MGMHNHQMPSRPPHTADIANVNKTTQTFEVNAINKLHIISACSVCKNRGLVLKSLLRQ